MIYDKYLWLDGLIYHFMNGGGAVVLPGLILMELMDNDVSGWGGQGWWAVITEKNGDVESYPPLWAEGKPMEFHHFVG